MKFIKDKIRERLKVKEYEVECLLEYNGEPLRYTKVYVKAKTRRHAKQIVNQNLSIRANAARKNKKKK